jgi:hypothetical protein
LLHNYLYVLTSFSLATPPHPCIFLRQFGLDLYMQSFSTSRLVLAAFLAITLAAAAEATPPLYQNSEYRFSVQPPAGSKVHYLGSAGADTGFDARTSDGNILYVRAEPSPTDQLPEFAEEQARAAAKVCGKNMQQSSSDTKLAGMPAMEMRFTCSSPDPNDLGQTRLLIVRFAINQLPVQTVVYTVGVITTTKRESRASQSYDSFAETFQLQGGQMHTDDPL